MDKGGIMFRYSLRKRKLISSVAIVLGLSLCTAAQASYKNNLNQNKSPYYNTYADNDLKRGTEESKIKEKLPREFSQDTYATAADDQLNKKIRDKVSRGWLWNS